MSVSKKIDQISDESLEGGFSIFDLPPTQVAVHKSSIRELLPLSALNQAGPFVFRLFSDNQYCDLSKTFLWMTSSIEVKKDGEWAPLGNTKDDDKNVSVVQNYGHSFIKSLGITINGVEVFNSGVYYAYRAYMMHELGYSLEVKKAFHEASCYYADDIGQNSYLNKGFVNRKKRFEEGKICETMIKLNFDLARQPNLLLNNSDVIFNIHRNTDNFLIHAPQYKTVEYSVAKKTDWDAAAWKTNSGEYRIKIHDMRLFVKTLDAVPSLNVAIAQQLLTTPAKYPMRKIEMRSVFLSKGRTEVSHNVFTSTIPRRLVVCFVETAGFSGNRDKTPFEFVPANIRTISAEAGANVFPSTPYLFDFGKEKFIRAFIDMYVGLGMDEGNRTISITMPQFKNGWCFFIIPMTSTLDANAPGFELIKNSTTTIKAQFNEPIPDAGMEMIILGEFDNILTINADRVLSSDGSV